MIGEYPDRQGPRVVRHNGKIGIIGNDEGTDFGFLLTAASAVEIATKLLSAVDDLPESAGDALFAHDVEGITFKASNVPGMEAGVLTLQINGAPMRGILTPTQIAEMAVAFTKASKWIDSLAKRPRKDR